MMFTIINFGMLQPKQIGIVHVSFHRKVCSSLSPDPTLTVEAVAAALQTVKEWWRIAEWLEVPYSIQHSIRASHSTDGERKKALAEYFINTLPAPSWRSLAGALSCCEDTAALQAVSSHLQREDGT